MVDPMQKPKQKPKVKSSPRSRIRPHVYAKEAIVLRILLQKKTYGLDIVHLSGGSIVANTVYMTLRRMTQKKYVMSRREKTGQRRRIYELTPLGRELARTAISRETHIRRRK